MPPQRVFNKSVADVVATLIGRSVVVNPKHVQVVFLDNPRDLRLHPSRHGWIGGIDLPAFSYRFSITGHHPIGMLFAQLRSAADALDLHP